MNDESSKPGWWAALGALGALDKQEAAPSDYADMGTVLGLEASMHRACDAADVVAEAPASGSASASASADDPFERRLVRRDWA